MNVSKITIASLAVCTLALATPPALAQKLYWVQGPTKIFRANLNGSGLELIFEGQAGVTGLDSVTVDGRAGKIYFTNPGEQKIHRANLDGSDIEELVTTGLGYPAGIAVDPDAGHIYWADPSLGTIRRANLDGSGVQDIYVTEWDPAGIALDLDKGKMYWTEPWGFRIQRANLDGSSVEELVPTEGGYWPISIALDLPRQRMYWTFSDIEWGFGGKIQRANLDGSGVEDIIVAPEQFVDIPSEIAIDQAGQKMYWTVFPMGDWIIQRANLDGTGIEDLTGLFGARGIALDLYEPPVPTVSAWGLVVMGLLLLTAATSVLSRRGSPPRRRKYEAAAEEQGNRPGLSWTNATAGRNACSFIILYGSLSLVAPSQVMGALTPRTALPKLATITKPAYETSLAIKFRDELRVRAVNGQLSSSATPPVDLSCVHSVTSQYTLTYETLIDLPGATLAQLENRAAQHSGVAQPDLAGMMVVQGADAILEDAANALNALDEVEWVYFAAVEADEPCDDIEPPTPDYTDYPLGGSPCYGFGGDYHDSDPGVNMIAAWNAGARGQGIKIADVETFYNRTHEDLCVCTIEDPPPGCNVRETPEQAQRLFPSAPKELDHGTSILGMLVALDNGYGWTGLVPDAEVWFFSQNPEVGHADVSTRVTAITNAVATVDEGDIVLLEVQTYRWTAGGLRNYMPAETVPAVWAVTRLAVDSRIIMVAVAGNGNWNLDCPDCPECPGGLGCFDFSYYQSLGDSGAILVGGGTPDSNHDSTNRVRGQRVNVQGWSSNIFTLGNSGDLILGTDIELGGDPNQRYTCVFGGTSGATPMVAGSAAAIQSYAEAEFCRRLTPGEMRQLLIDTGIPQGAATQDQHIGPFPNVGAAIDDLGTSGDCDSDGITDACEVAVGGAVDCNVNLIPDDCDISSGSSADSDGDGLPDECPKGPLAAPYPHDRRKNRYMSFDPNKAENDGKNIAFKVELKQITLGSCSDGEGGGTGGFCRRRCSASILLPCNTDADCPQPPGEEETCTTHDCNTCSEDRNVCIDQPVDCAPSPSQTCEGTGQTCVNDAPDSLSSNVGQVWWIGPEDPSGKGVHLMVSEAYRKESTNWANPTHVGDCEIVPQAEYSVLAIDVATGYRSAPLSVETTQFSALNAVSWGDGVGQLKKFCGGDIQTPECVDDNDCTAPQTCDLAWTLPDGATGNDDINAALALISSPSTMPPPDVMWVDLHGNDSGLKGAHNVDPPNFRADFADVAFLVQAQYTRPYPFKDPADCPDTSAWPDYQAPTPPAGSPQFTLVASGDLFDPSEDVQIEVYVSEATNVFAYEVALEVTGGTGGSLMVTDITVDQNRSDYVFYQIANPLQAKNLPGMRVGGCFNTALPGITWPGQVYLATFTLQPVAGATGVFNIDVRGAGRSFLLNPDGSAQDTDTSGAAVVGFGVDCLDVADCDDNNECTTDSCTASNECQYTNVASGTVCDDGLWCTAGPEACDGNGLCTGGDPRCPPGYLCDESGQQCFGEPPP